MSPEKHLDVLQRSSHVVLAMEGDRVIGFINAISDGRHAAFVSLLEVLPEYRRAGIGSELVRRMLDELRDYPCIDLTCDAALQPFYGRCGMQQSVGMILREYDRAGPNGT